jgi:hypothetical protein
MGPKGRKAGAVKYQPDVLLNIIRDILPMGGEAWDKVCDRYHIASGELHRRDRDDVKKYFTAKMCNGFKKMTGESEPAKAIRESQKVYASITRKYSAQAYGKPDDEDDEEDEDDEDDDGDDNVDNDDDDEDDEDNNVEDGSQITLEPAEIRAETQPFPAAVPVIDNEPAPMAATTGNKKRKRKTF